MRTVVSKFGGSSTADAGMFRKIRKIIESHPERRYVILSAPGTGAGHTEKITNLLYRCWDLHAVGGDYMRPLKAAAGRFSEISLELGLPDFSDFAEKCILQGLSDSKDHIASRGEYLCAFLFARWTGLPMVDACDIIHFTRDGDLDCKKTEDAVSEMKKRFPHVVFEGCASGGMRMDYKSLRTFSLLSTSDQKAEE